MLQWMGGSRRKVNDSRRSKQKRQKQYFEQRKRQQNEHITSSVDNFVDGYNTCNQNQNEKRSLDVLSLHSLSQVAERSSSTCDGILKVDPLPDKCPKTKNMPKFIKNIATPANNVETLQIRNISNNTEQRMPAEEFRVDTSKLYNSTFKEGNRKGEEQKHASGHKFEYLSVFELIDEDGKSSNKSEEKTEYEAHVAFSMQGLGKVGTETPVKSPQPSRSRIMSNGQSGFFKAAKHEYSCRKFDDVLENHEMVQESMIEDSDMFLNGKYSSSDCGQSWRFGSYDHPKLHCFKDDSIKLFNKKPWVKCFDDKESIDDIQEIHANFLEARSSFPVGNTFNENFDIDGEIACFTDVYNISTAHEEDFTEDFSFSKRSYSDQYGMYGQADRFYDLDFHSRYPRHHLEEGDYDFLKSDDSNYFIGNKFTNAGAKQSHFSYLKADNPLDNFSSLSGESSSSSAVKRNGIIGGPPARKSRKRSSEFIGDPSKHQTTKEDFYGELGNSTCIPGQQRECERPRAYSRRPVHADFSDFALGESFGQVDDCTGKDGFHSTNIRHTNKDHSRNCEPVGDDIFGLLSASNFHFDSHLSFGGCKDDSSVESATPMDLPSKKSAFGQHFSPFTEKGCGKNRKGSYQQFGTFVQSSGSTEVSGKRENKDFLTEQCSADRNAYDNNFNENSSNEEELCRGPEGTASVTPKPLQETHEKLSKKNTDDTSSFFGLSDNSGSRASEKECRNDNLDLQAQELDSGPSESEQKSVGSDGENSSIEPSYQVMMLESHMLRLLCVKKKRKSAKEEILKRV